MHFSIQKDVLIKALRDVSNAIASRNVQPVLSHVFIETLDDVRLRFVGTDLDMTIQSVCSGAVTTPGAICLPGKKLVDVVSKLPSDLVTFQTDKQTEETTVTCKRSRFNISGLPSQEYPKPHDLAGSEGFRMPVDILRRSITQTAFAATTSEASSILGGVYMVIENGVFEATATDGSRLAHRREELAVACQAKKKTDNDTEMEGKSVATMERQLPDLKAIVPARACAELLKIMDSRDPGATVRVCVTEGQIFFESENHLLSTRLIGGTYPRYQELFPKEYSYLAVFDREEALAAVERVAVMSDERTNLVKVHFEGDSLEITANTPDVGKASEEVSIQLDGQVIDIAVNVRYVCDVLQRLSEKNVRLEMTGPLKPLIFKGETDENYKYLLMPVQAK
jgi:DNA polymerase III subunit beta